MRRIIPFLMMCFCAPEIVVSQHLEYAQGEIIVQLADNIETSAISLPHFSPQSRNSKTNWRSIRNAPFNLHVLTIDYKQYNENTYIQELMNDPNVLYAQRNKFVSQRLNPDDSLYTRQWQYINTGSNGGLIGADIDADDAWEITTGGITAMGDTIVACVIDDGYDVDHEDMIDNLWINHGEIPGDGIDNDNNGYIDDVNGWNFMHNNNDISPNGSHGTPVAGIVGAKGNNKKGVAGVNWNVKLMIIKYKDDLTESNVLESYSYAYEKRKKYNETNGAEGAFVVSTNASWGIDGGDPTESPIWCSFYDALGEVGILNCGATANAELNVDVQGDLPTGCSSDYLVSVTNMDRNDLKVNGSGYGRTTIDIGAHGRDAYTVEANNRYGGFGGTSGATPHVTGAIALLYSVPCNELIKIAKTNPSLAALAVKEILLNTVDELNVLDGITTSRGRLNLGKAVQRAQNLCSTNGDAYGFVPNIEEVGTITFNWNENKSNIKTDIRIRPFDGELWKEYLNVKSGFQVADLDICTMYEYQTRSYPTGQTTPYGFSRFVETKGCCYVSNIDFVEVIDNKAIITMSNSLSDIDNILEYRKFGQVRWDTIIVKSTATFDNLIDCDLLEYRISTICNKFSNRSETGKSSFITTECGECTILEYCEVENLDNSDEWIESVKIGNRLNKSGQGNSSFNEYTGGFMPKLALNLSYPIELTPGFADTEFGEFFKILIDMNQDGFFDKDNELVYSSIMSSSAPVIDQFTMPGDAALGITRMRIIMSYNSTIDVCNSESSFGEVEDYCVEITEVSNTTDLGDQNQSIKISPSVTIDELMVSFARSTSKIGQLSIYDITGQKHYSKVIHQTNTPITVNASSWARGTFIVVYTLEDKVYSERLIKI